MKHTQFSANSESYKDVENIIGIRPQALTSNFKQIMNHTNPKYNKQCKTNQKVTYVFAVKFRLVVESHFLCQAFQPGGSNDGGDPGQSWGMGQKTHWGPDSDIIDSGWIIEKKLGDSFDFVCICLVCFVFYGLVLA